MLRHFEHRIRITARSSERDTDTSRGQNRDCIACQLYLCEFELSWTSSKSICPQSAQTWHRPRVSVSFSQPPLPATETRIELSSAHRLYSLIEVMLRLQDTRSSKRAKPLQSRQPRPLSLFLGHYDNPRASVPNLLPYLFNPNDPRCDRERYIAHVPIPQELLTESEEDGALEQKYVHQLVYRPDTFVSPYMFVSRRLPGSIATVRQSESVA